MKKGGHSFFSLFKRKDKEKVNRQSKHLFVEDLQKKLEEASLVVVVRQTGLTVSEMDQLRADVRGLGAFFKVPKNTLARLAIKGTSHEGLKSFLSGPTALAYSADPIAAAKAMSEFSKKNPKLEIVGGGLNGAVLKAQDIKALAALPSLDELRGKIVGLLVAPASQIARVVCAPASQLARVVQAYASKS